MDIAAVHGFADDPTKVGLLIDPLATNPPVTIASLLELTDEAIVVGSRFPDDIFRTTFDRFMGIAVDDGKLSHQIIPASELVRIERFAAAGAYAGPPPPPAQQLAPRVAPPPPPPSENSLDIDDMMG